MKVSKFLRRAIKKGLIEYNTELNKYNCLGNYMFRLNGKYNKSMTFIDNDLDDDIHYFFQLDLVRVDVIDLN